MHEQLFREFTERAEAEIALPDLAALEERGRRLRRDRSRAAVAAAAAALVLLAGSLVLVLTVGGDGVPPAPQPDPGPTGVEHARGEALSAGRVYTVPVFGQGYADTVDPGETIVATFTVDGTGWVWFRDSMTRFAPGARPDDPSAGPSATVWIPLVDRIPVDPCPTYPPTMDDGTLSGHVRWTDAASDPLAVARQIAALDRVEVHQQPTSGELLGYPAAHLRFAIPEACPRGRVTLLWSMFPTTSLERPGMGIAFRDHQEFDVWVLDVEGSMVLLGVDHSPGAPRSVLHEANAIADSVRIEVLRQ